MLFGSADRQGRHCILQGVDYVALDKDQQRLLTYAYSPTQLRKVSVPLDALKACSSMVLTTDMRDACIYILSKPVIDKIAATTEMSSIKVCGSRYRFDS